MSKEPKELSNAILASIITAIVSILVGIVVGGEMNTEVKDSLEGVVVTVSDVKEKVVSIDMRVETQFADITGKINRITINQDRTYQRMNDFDEDLSDLTGRVSVVESKIELK